MIRGYFSGDDARRRPFIRVVFQFPTVGEGFEVPALIDTGADRTILAPFDALRLMLQFGIDISTFEQGLPNAGVGGQVSTRLADVVLQLDTFSTPLQLTIIEPSSI